MNNYAPPLQGTANNLAQYGRYGDSMLVHMNPVEVEGIASLSPTGSLTINPVTGQPEAFLPFLAPLLGGLAGTTFLTGLGGAGVAGMGLSAAAAGAIGSGLGSWAATGDIEQGLISGLTGYGIGSALGKVGTAAPEALTPALAPTVASTIPDAATSTVIDSAANIIGPRIVPEVITPALAPEAIGTAVTAAPTVSAAQGISPYQAATTPGERMKVLSEHSGEIIPNLIETSPLIAPGLMAVSEYEAQEDLDDKFGRDSREKEKDLQRQRDILRRAWGQINKDYPSARTGGLIQKYDVGGLVAGKEPIDTSVEGAAARQASIRGSTPSDIPRFNAQGQPWRAGFDPEHNYFTSGSSIPDKPILFGDVGGRDVPVASGDSSIERKGDYKEFMEKEIIARDAGLPPSAFNYNTGLRYGDPAPERRDYEGEGGGREYKSDMKDWRDSQTQESIFGHLGGNQPLQTPGRPTETAPPPEETYSIPPMPPALSPEDMATVLGSWNPEDRIMNFSGLPPQAIGRPTEGQPPPQAMPPMPPPQAMAPPPPPPPPPQAMPPMPPPQAMAPPVMQPLPPAPPPPPIAEAKGPSPLSLLPELGQRPSRSDYEDEGGAREYRADLREWKELEALRDRQGYQEGGIVDLAANDPAMMAEQPVDPAMQQESQMTDALVQQTIMAILGRVDDPDIIIDMFIDQFGQEAYLALRDEVLNMVVPGAQTEGLIEGQGDGMSDEVMGMIGDQEQVATSPGEYIVAADVVSGIGNGSSDAGAQELDGMMANIRQARTGMEEQPPMINARGAMPA